jgi:hypothetical protein
MREWFMWENYIPFLGTPRIMTTDSHHLFTTKANGKPRTEKNEGLIQPIITEH